MKIEVIKIVSIPTSSSVAIDKDGRLYRRTVKNRWIRYKTFCTRYENREFFTTLEKNHKVVCGRLFIEVIG